MIFTHTLNEEKRIGRLLDSLKKQKHIEFRVVISDNFSADTTVEIINSYCKDINLTLIYPPRQILLLDHFFYVAEYCKNILGKDEGIIYIGADDYFLESTYLEELIETRIKFPKSIVVPNFVIDSLSSVTRVTTRGQYKNRSKYVRLFRFLIANHHHGSRFNLGLFNREMFIYRLDRELMYSKNYDFNSRNSIGEFFTLIDLILKYTVIVNSRATFVKEVNNRNITEGRKNENHTKIEISRLNAIRNLFGKNMSTFRLLKHRRAKHKAIIFAYRVVGFISFVRNSSYDLYLYCKKHFVR